jgi:hypothetical protein
MESAKNELRIHLPADDMSVEARPFPLRPSNQ